MIRVVAAGTFDGIHAGHRYYLREAKKRGDRLTVIVARDATVLLIKGKRTRRSERQRRAAVAALPEADAAVLGLSIRRGRDEDRFRILRSLRPDVICLGYDQPVRASALRRFLDAHGLARARIVRLKEAPALYWGRRNQQSCSHPKHSVRSSSRRAASTLRRSRRPSSTPGRTASRSRKPSSTLA